MSARRRGRRGPGPWGTRDAPGAHLPPPAPLPAGSDPEVALGKDARGRVRLGCRWGPLAGPELRGVRGGVDSGGLAVPFPGQGPGGTPQGG